MKKIIALLLCISAVLMASAGCTKDLTNEDPGAIIPVYLSTEITNFDPAYSNLDKATTKVLGLIYEGLYTLDAKGKPVKNQAKSVKVLDKPSDAEKCILERRHTGSGFRLHLRMEAHS